MHIMQQQPGHSEIQTVPVFIQPVITLNKENGLFRCSIAKQRNLHVPTVSVFVAILGNQLASV